MRDQHELDQWLKQKFDDAQFEFDPAAWEAAEQLIDEQDAPRLAWLWWARGLGILLLVMLLAFPIVFWRMNKANANREKDSSHALILSPENSFPQNPQPIPFDHTLNLPKNNQDSSSPSNNHDQNTLDTLNSSQLAIDDQLLANAPKAPLLSSQNTLRSGTQQPNTLPKNTLLPSIQQTNTFSQNATQQTGNQKAEELLAAPQISETENTLISSLKQLEAFDSLNALSFQFGLDDRFPKPSTQRPIHAPVKRHSIGLTTGSNLSLGLINQGPSRSGAGALPYVGIHYSFDPKPTSPLLRLESGVFLMSRNGLSGSKSFRSINFGFGFEEEVITLTPKALHALEIPLTASFRIYNRHYVTIGASGSYLLEITTQEQLQQTDDFGTSTPDKKYVWGYRKGFNKLDVGAQLGYRYYMGRGFSLNLQGYYGLMDLTDNDFWENDQFDRNMQLRVFLRYDLFQL